MIPFIDANCRLGSRPGGEEAVCRDAAGLLDEMGRAGVDKALVWHASQWHASAADGNALLERELQVQGRLTGVYAALPPHTGETAAPRDLPARMAAMGAKALRLFPKKHRYVADALSLGHVLEIACEHRILVFFSCGGEEQDYPAVYRLLKDFPGLVCVLCDFGDWGEERNILPLLDGYTGVHVETSLICMQDGALEYLAERVGPSRLLFGSGFPDRSMFQARFALLHADLPDDAKRAVASGNLERLLEGVRLP